MPCWPAPAGCWRAKIWCRGVRTAWLSTRQGRGANAREALPDSFGPLIRDLDSTRTGGLPTGSPSSTR